MQARGGNAPTETCLQEVLFGELRVEPPQSLSESALCLWWDLLVLEAGGESRARDRGKVQMWRRIQPAAVMDCELHDVVFIGLVVLNSLGFCDAEREEERTGKQ